MPRNPSTTTTGGPFSQATINAVWAKAQVAPGYDANVTRKDACRAWIQKPDYGQTTDYGWEIDHIKPVSKGGTDDLSNLQPLQWKNNRHKGDDWPSWGCALAS